MRNIRDKLNEIYLTLDNLKDGANLDLLGGKCGISLFQFYYANYTSNQDAYEKACDNINDILESTNTGLKGHSFASGAAGTAWTLQHIIKYDFIYADADEMLDKIDDFLYTSMINSLKSGNYDYLHGAIGIGLYFLTRNESPKIIGYLEDMISEIDKVVEKEKNGIKLQMNINISENRKGFNLSLSHGMASLIIILCKLYNKGIKLKTTKRLIEESVRYVLQQKLPDNQYNSLFPSLALEEMTKFQSSRLAWCYGDLGTSVALWHASQTLGRKDWEDESINIILHSAKRRNLQQNGVVDAGLCHGTAGIAHIFNRMYGYTGLKECKEASDYWFEQTLKMAKFEDGLAGYKAWQGEKHGWVNELGLLEGIAGIGLALISAVSDIEPDWDECLLLS